MPTLPLPAIRVVHPSLYCIIILLLWRQLVTNLNWIRTETFAVMSCLWILYFSSREGRINPLFKTLPSWLLLASLTPSLRRTYLFIKLPWVLTKLDWPPRLFRTTITITTHDRTDSPYAWRCTGSVIGVNPSGCGQASHYNIVLFIQTSTSMAQIVFSFTRMSEIINHYSYIMFYTMWLTLLIFIHVMHICRRKVKPEAAIRQARTCLTFLSKYSDTLVLPRLNSGTRGDCGSEEKKHPRVCCHTSISDCERAANIPNTHFPIKIIYISFFNTIYTSYTMLNWISTPCFFSPTVFFTRSGDNRDFFYRISVYLWPVSF